MQRNKNYSAVANLAYRSKLDKILEEFQFLILLFCDFVAA